MMAQGWPSDYPGVMLQGFYWDSFTDSKWTKLEAQADNFKGYFDLVWVPQSGKTNGSTSMGYDPYYYFNQNSSFGSEEQLKSMIKAFKDRGIGTIADVVINHRNTSGWYTFPAETWRGTTYQMLPSDIVANDDGGKTAAEAAANGVSVSKNNDEGEGWDGMRDLDHMSANVQNVIKAYEKFLVEEMGYTGFRYDMVKGFSATHIADYNTAAGVKYSVGEYWDGNNKIENWVKNTNYKSAAFDFQFRYNVRDAINNNNWGALKSDNNMMHDPAFRQYAVTFVENHDMQDRGTTNNYTPDPIRRDTLAANAYMLAMPGTPCVFYTHYLAYPQEIKEMVEARKLAGITNMSDYTFLRTGNAMSAVKVTGTKATLVAVVGNTASYTPASSTYTKILSGHHYAYYLSRDSETPFVDTPSGEYTDPFSVTATVVSANDDAKLVYTLDGKQPTASSKQVANGGKINITEDCTLTLGLLVNGVITKTITRNYSFKQVQPEVETPIKVYVNADKAGSAFSTWTGGLNFWAWNDGGNLYKAWPGQKMTTTATVEGKKWVVADYKLTTSNPTISFVFSVGSGSPQTVDIQGISKTSYLEITSAKDGQGHYEINDVTASTGIEGIQEQTTDNGQWYTLQGVRIAQPAEAGIYIHNGKKVVVRK